MGGAVPVGARRLLGGSPNNTASSIARTSITASVTSELVPAPASTACSVKTPVPTILSITRAVEELTPSSAAERGSQ